MAKRKPDDRCTSVPHSSSAEASRASASDQPPSLGLDDGQAAAEAHGDQEPPLVLPARARGQQGDAGRPYCPRHNVLMVAYATKPEKTHYKCPVEACDETAKRVRPTLRVPAAPQLCPQRHCRRDGQAMALETVGTLSTVAQLHMQCPRCGFALKVPRPQFEPALERRRAAVEDLAER